MPRPAKDITGQRFGRLTAVERISGREHNSYWKCLCDCGQTSNVQLSSLRAGSSTSCGCFRSEQKTKLSLSDANKEKLLQKLQDKFGAKAPELISPFQGFKKLHKFRCVRCSSLFTFSPTRLLSEREVPCYCLAQNRPEKHTLDNAKLESDYGSLVRTLHTSLFYAPSQIAELTGLNLRAILRLLGDSRIARVSSSVHMLSSKQAYLRQVSLLTEYMYRSYKEVIDSKGKRGSNYHLDHSFSRYDALTHPLGPLDVRFVAHPANLKIIRAKENLTKQRQSDLTFSALKRRIKAFNLEHGKVEFPSHFKYDFTPKAYSGKGLRVMGLDPGTVNFGVFVGDLIGKSSLFSIEVIESLMLDALVKKIDADIGDQVDHFSSSVKDLMLKHQPDVVVMERFQSRLMGGSTIEAVNIMIGCVANVVYQVSEELGKNILFKLVTAATWKNRLNQIVDLSLIYSLAPKKLIHRLDACLMACYVFPSTENVYKIFGSKYRASSLVESLENVVST